MQKHNKIMAISGLKFVYNVCEYLDISGTKNVIKCYETQDINGHKNGYNYGKFLLNSKHDKWFNISSM